MKKFLSLILAFVLIFSLSISSFAATDITFPELKTGWSVSSSGSVTSPSGFNASWWRVILDQLVPIKTALTSTTSGLRHDIASIYTDLVLGGTGSTKNNLASLVTNTGNLSEIRTNTASANTNLTTIASRLAYAGTGIGELTHDILTNTNTIKSDLSSSKGLLGYIKDDVAHLEEVLADDDDKSLKDDSKDNQLKAQDEFFGDGANSVSSDNLGSLSSLVSAFRSFLGDDIGLGNLDLAGWEEITSSDDPWQFFTDGDAVAESMGVSASPVSSPDFPDTPQGGGGGGGDIPDIPVTPPDEDEFPNDGKTYLHLKNVSNAFDFGFNDEFFPEDYSDDEFIEIVPGDYFYITWGQYAYTNYSISVNGMFFDSSQLFTPVGDSEIVINTSNNITLEIFPSEPGSYVGSRLVSFVVNFVEPSPSPSRASLKAFRYDPNAVVTSYYEDNKTALWGWLH